jgi:hypothetical protein
MVVIVFKWNILEVVAYYKLRNDDQNSQVYHKPQVEIVTLVAVLIMFW